MTIIGKLIISLWLLAFVGCHMEDESNCSGSVKGILRNYTGLDGCGWIIQLTDSTLLEPTNLNDFNISMMEGKEIYFRYRVKDDMASICMVGKIVEIDCIRQE